MFFFFNYTATTYIYPDWHTLSLHDALPISPSRLPARLATRAGGISRCLALDGASLAAGDGLQVTHGGHPGPGAGRSEEHTSELQSLMRSAYAGFCLKKKKHNTTQTTTRYATKQTKRRMP